MERKSEMTYERPYYIDIAYPPVLFYIVFGTNGDLALEEGKALPQGLEAVTYKGEGHKKYMQSILGGSIGEILKNENQKLYEKALQTEGCVVISGAAAKKDDLKYLKATMEYIQALMKGGAIAVLDLLTYTLFGSEEWIKLCNQDFTPFEHASIMVSEMADDSAWLHTMGMRKFGRPDISIELFDKTKLKDAIAVINSMICLGAQGAFYENETRIELPDGRAYMIKPNFINDFGNPEFNNAYYRILWEECVLAEE